MSGSTNDEAVVTHTTTLSKDKKYFCPNCGTENKVPIHWENGYYSATGYGLVWYCKKCNPSGEKIIG